MKELFDWGRSKGITFNPEKTKAMVLNTNNNSAATLTMNGKPIGIVEDLKILGITIDRRLNFNKHIKERAAKATELTTKLTPMMSNVWGIQPSARQMLYLASHRTDTDLWYATVLRKMSDN